MKTFRKCIQKIHYHVLNVSSLSYLSKKVQLLKCWKKLEHETFVFIGHNAILEFCESVDLLYCDRTVAQCNYCILKHKKGTVLDILLKQITWSICLILHNKTAVFVLFSYSGVTGMLLSSVSICLYCVAIDYKTLSCSVDKNKSKQDVSLKVTPAMNQHQSYSLVLDS